MFYRSAILTRYVFLIREISILFSIKFIEPELGEIQIDDFKETFQTSLSYWRQGQYEQEWRSSVNRLKNGKNACFITSITDPLKSNFIWSWECYPIKNEFVFQERIIFLEELSNEFDEKDPHTHVHEYESISENGEQISEWRTSEL
ncbi:MAG: hypothetical protein AB8B84_08085 [Granulosicoccus sp.]